MRESVNLDHFEDEEEEEKENFRPNKKFDVDFEAQKLSSKEEELMQKAKDLENEMRQIRQAKVDVVVR